MQDEVHSESVDDAGLAWRLAARFSIFAFGASTLCLALKARLRQLRQHLRNRFQLHRWLGGRVAAIKQDHPMGRDYPFPSGASELGICNNK
jgi:hypothetical protein